MDSKVLLQHFVSKSLLWPTVYDGCRCDRKTLPYFTLPVRLICFLSVMTRSQFGTQNFSYTLLISSLLVLHKRNNRPFTTVDRDG